jgi:hypothetical protein
MRERRKEKKKAVEECHSKRPQKAKPLPCPGTKRNTSKKWKQKQSKKS